MSLNPEFDGIASAGQPADGAQVEVKSAVAIAEPVVTPAYQPAPPLQTAPWEAQLVVAPARPRKGAGWIVPAAIAAVGLIASGTLGYFLYATTGQRDAARHQLASTQVTLADTQKQLADRKATDAYVHMYVSNSGLVLTEYQKVVLCDSYVTCRPAAQDALTNMKAFQSARSSVAVPSALASADSQTGDALSAAIAADQELITGMDTNDKARIDDGFNKLYAAMLSFAKAESALAAGLS